MANVSISAVTQNAFESDSLFAGWIDTPAPGYQADGLSVHIGGWVLGREAQAKLIELTYDEMVIRTVPLALARLDVAAVYPDYPESHHFETCGFATSIGTLGLAEEFVINVDVIHVDGRRTHWAEIHGQHQPLRTDFSPTLQPLMVTCLGRTGTTLIMRLLADHHAIVLQRMYAYEARWGAYWMHTLKVLAEPGTFLEPRYLVPYLENLEVARQNPFNVQHYTQDTDVFQWLNRDYPAKLAAVCQQSTEEFYQVLARSQGQASPVYFAEKCFPGIIPDVTWELYPRAREIFSVRDFRDMLCSIIAFVAKPRRTVLEYSSEDSIDMLVQRLSREVALLLQSWKRRSVRAHLVRYEDLVLHPAETLERLFEYLGVGLSRARIEAIIDNVARTTPELSQHGTTESAEQSIGRWKRDLDPALRRIVEDECGAALAEFGYAS